jgi:CheY-like chemotaxis protein
MIFDPFFTTKEQGKGTGLGLSAVYGIVQEHHGCINVNSEEGVGTVFHVMLPLAEEDTLVLGKKEQQSVRGTGRILFVDDEELIRSSGKFILEELGYEVILAENGRDAVEIFQKRQKEIDLVILDMIMPEMNGTESFYKMREIDPNCKVIISSGFVKNESLDDLHQDGLVGFVNKPFRIAELSYLLSNVLKEVR